MKLQSWGHCDSNGEYVCFLYSPYLVSLIPCFDRVTGPGVYRAGVETGLANCSGYAPFSIPPGSLCYPSPTLLIAPQGGLYPWIVTHPCSTALGSPKARLAARGGQAQAASGWGSSRAGLEVLLWGAQRELNWSQVVWIDHW